MLHVQLGTRRLLHFGARPSHFAPFPGRLLLPADSEGRHRGVKKKEREREREAVEEAKEGGVLTQLSRNWKEKERGKEEKGKGKDIFSFLFWNSNLQLLLRFRRLPLYLP